MNNVIEKAGFSVGELADSKLVPFYIEMQTSVPVDTNTLLEINPLQVIRFPLLNGYFTGTLEKVSLSPSKKNAQTITLRGVFSNDYNKLLKYYG